MSNAVMPKWPGRTFSVKKTPSWNTIKQVVTSGKSVRIQNFSSPIWKFSLTLDHLRAKEIYSTIGQVPVAAALTNVSQLMANDYFALIGFCNGRQGQWDSWLYDDDSDDCVAQAQIGVGAGASANYQAIRILGEYSEPIQNLNGAPVSSIGVWSPNLPVASNALALPTLTAIRTQGGFVLGWQTPGWPNYFQCTTAGTTGANEPYWRNAPVVGSTITDGSATWTNQGVPLVLWFNLNVVDWAASHAYTAGNAVIPTTNNAGGYGFVTNTSATSSATRPSFPQSLGATVTDGGVTWTNIGKLVAGAGGFLVPQPTTYTVGSAGPGLITCGAATNTQIFLTSGFYFRCIFSDDSQDFEEIFRDVWQVKELKFESIKL